MNFVVKSALLFRAFVISAFPMALFFSMTRLRTASKTKWILYGILVSISAFINFSLIFLLGHEQMMRVFVLLLLIPSSILLLIYSKDRLSQIFFNFFTSVNALYFTSILSHFISGPANSHIFLDALIRALFLSCILFVFRRYLIGPYHFLAANMKKSWGMIAAIPFLFFALVMFLGLYPHVRSDNLPGVVFLYIILGFVYYIIYQVFHNTFNLIQQQQDNELLKTQVQALSRQADAMRRSEDQISIYRHDFRHYVQSIAALIQTGEYKKALEFTGTLEQKFSQTKPPQYCVNPVINAILSLYINRAQEDGITVRTNCDIPLSLPADIDELSIVFANAIENACNACRKLPDGKERIIQICCISFPQFILEISNTFDGTVEFNEQHLPVSNEDNHGIGIRSIVAFAEKYHAILDYKIDGNMFCFRLLINNS